MCLMMYIYNYSFKGFFMSRERARDVKVMMNRTSNTGFAF